VPESFYDWSYLWRGGRDDGDGMLMMPGGTEQDTYQGNPVREDAYAYQSYSLGGFFDGELNHWTGVQENDAFSGTQGQWSAPTTYDIGGQMYDPQMRYYTPPAWESWAARGRARRGHGVYPGLWRRCRTGGMGDGRRNVGRSGGWRGCRGWHRVR
jgi:hypothetical protein